MAVTHPHSLPTAHLQPNPLQPRGKVLKEDLEELVQSVKTYGILEPIVVAHTPAGYQIIAGERRWRAAKLAGLNDVPVVIKETTPKGMLEMALIENVQRVDLSPMERAQAFHQLQRDFRFSTTQMAERIGKSPAFISNSVKLLELPDAVKDGLAGNLISEGHARALLGIGNDKVIIDCYKQIMKENASVRRAEELARFYREKAGKPRRATVTSMMTSPLIDRWQTSLQRVFNAKTKVKLQQSARQTTLTFVFKGTPSETQHELEKVLEIVKRH